MLREIKKMRYITPRPQHYKQDEVKVESLKNINKN